MSDGAADLAFVLEAIGHPPPPDGAVPPDLGSPRRTHVYVVDDIVVKCDDRFDTGSMTRECNALTHLASSDLPVPRLLHRGSLPDGRGWVVLGRLAGVVPADAAPLAHLLSPGLAAELGDVAARLHAVPGPPTFGTWTLHEGGAGRSMRAEDGRRIEVLAEMARAADIVPPAELERLLAAMAWTREAAAVVTAPVVAHRDLQPRNVLVGAGGVLTALLDFESSAGGDPVEDFRVVALDWSTPAFRRFCHAYAGRARPGSLGPDAPDRLAHHVLTWVLAIYAYLGGIRPEYLPPATAALDRILDGDRPDLRPLT